MEHHVSEAGPLLCQTPIGDRFSPVSHGWRWKPFFELCDSLSLFFSLAAGGALPMATCTVNYCCCWWFTVYLFASLFQSLFFVHVSTKHISMCHMDSILETSHLSASKWPLYWQCFLYSCTLCPPIELGPWYKTAKLPSLIGSSQHNGDRGSPRSHRPGFW